MKQTTKNGVVLLAAGLVVSGFVNHGEWDLANVVSQPGQEEAVSRTQVPSLVFSMTKEKREDEDEPTCLLYTSPSPRDGLLSRMPSSA